MWTESQTFPFVENSAVHTSSTHQDPRGLENHRYLGRVENEINEEEKELFNFQHEGGDRRESHEFILISVQNIVLCSTN